MKNNDFYRKKAGEIRQKVLKMAFNGKGAHIGSSLSIVDILTILYYKILSINPKNPQDENRDRFILSKGHACCALYAILAKKGFFKEKLLDTYLQDGSVFAAHPNSMGIPGIEFSSGSLGHGLSIGAGMALAAKNDRKKHRVFVLLSDGECDEGTNWEAALFASHHKLDNLTAIIDCNKLQAFGFTKEVLNLEPLAKKWEAFGCSVREIDGHDYKQILESLKKAPFNRNKPNLIIAHTVKGKGVSFMENQLCWHYQTPSEEQLKIALRELSDQ